MTDTDIDPARPEVLTLQDLRPENRRTHELLEQILARLPAPEGDRRADILMPIAAVVRDEPFTVASVFAFADRSGAAGEPLRKALGDLSPKACGRLFARWAVAPAIVRVAESRGDGVLWRIVGDFENGKPLGAKREKLGDW